MPAPPGPTVLAGKFRLVEKLGEGGMGAVWQAEHLVLHSKVAIKLMGPEVAQTPEALARFLREAQAAAALRSPHVVQILDYGVDEKTPYIAMELLEGESLAARLARERTLSPEDTSRIITHMARALTRAHESGIVHRDLKPDNVFIVTNDEEQIAKLLDFGIAKSTSHGLSSGVDRATRTGAVLGSPYYMSPEQAEGLKTLDHRTDIWSLGVIAFECLLGRRPFESESLGGLVLAICTRPMPIPSAIGEVPKGFDIWFAKTCSRDPKTRYDSAKHAAAVLRELCHGKLERSFIEPSSRDLNMALGHTQLDSSQNVASGERKRSSRKVLAGVVAACTLIGGAAVARIAFSPSGTGSANPALDASPIANSAPVPPRAAPPEPRAEPSVAAPEPSPAVSDSKAPPASSSAASAPRAPKRTAPRPAPKPSASQRPRVNLGI